jgi:hypothetical protein
VNVVVRGLRGKDVIVTGKYVEVAIVVLAAMIGRLLV